MYRFFKTRKKQTQQEYVLFHGEGILDVTNSNAMSSDDSLGYMCGCDISVSQNGKIEIFSLENVKELLECFSVLDIVRASNNINNYDSTYVTEVLLITENKDLRISFQTKESKIEFWNALTTTYDNLKDR
ncbi:MAG: hypothetical protein ACI4KI_04140 [Candidatus Fimenecus sp.]